MTRDNTPTHSQFVINLCTLATPITIPQPRASKLARYSFFLSRAWIGGQRQYQLNMGYFSTATEAEKWLGTLKRVYPHACVSEAPESQPELMSNTQALRILNIGRISESDDVAHPVSVPVSDPVSTPASVSRVAHSSAPAREAHPSDRLPSSRELFVRDTGAHRIRKSEQSLEDTLNELRTSDLDVDIEEDLEGTGVRHLRIESAKG